MPELALAPFDKLIARGLDLDAAVAMFPAFFQETRDTIKIDVLDPAPAFDEARAVVSQWLVKMRVSPKRGKYCVAYMIGQDLIEASVITSNQQATYHGVIDRGSRTLSWERQEQ